MPPWAVALVAALALRAAAAALSAADVKNTISNETASKLLEAVRRQLLADNYDYLPSDSGEGLLAAPAAAPPRPRPRGDDEYDYSEGTDQLQHRTKQSTDTLTDENGPNLRANEEFKVEVDLKEIDDDALKTNATAANDHGIKKNDLYYYFDDQRLTHIDEELGEDVDPKQAVAATPGDTSKNATYKVLTLKSKSRRSNQMRRFIKEESAAGVAILSVDPGPFPEFRLPADRRQYMHDHGPRARDRPGPGDRAGPGPGDQTGPGPGDQTRPGPGDQTGPGPGDQTRPGPGDQTGPGPGDHTGPGPRDQPLPSAERNPADMLNADNL